MGEIISKGYARRSTREAAPGKIWYLPTMVFITQINPERSG